MNENAKKIGILELFHGDCIDVMSSIPDNSIDMVLADLPFGTTKQAWDKVIDMPALGAVPVTCWCMIYN